VEAPPKFDLLNSSAMRSKPGLWHEGAAVAGEVVARQGAAPRQTLTRGLHCFEKLKIQFQILKIDIVKVTGVGLSLSAETIHRSCPKKHHKPKHYPININMAAS
jgi:hypothetical protein